MTIGPDFASVLSAAQQGGDWAVALLYRDINPALLRYLRARAPEAADDLAGDTWLTVARLLGGFQGDESAFRGWVFTIAHRQVIGHWRRTDRRRTDPVAELPPEAQYAPDDPEHVAVSAVTADEAIARITGALPPDQAEVVLLRILADLSVEQVAAVMGKRPGTVRVLQHRAVRRLAHVFDDNWVEAVTP